MSDFGLNLLKSMGWKEDKIIGKNPISYQKEIKEVEPKKERIGLGSDNNDAIQQAKLRHKLNDTQFTQYQSVKIEGGIHKGMQGVIVQKKEQEYLVEINGQRVWISKAEIDGQRRQTVEQKNFQWMINDCVVQIISKKKLNLKFYLQKGLIVDRMGELLTVQLFSGELLADLTVEEILPVPPQLNDYCVVIDSQLKGIVIEIKDQTYYVLIDEEVYQQSQSNLCVLNNQQIIHIKTS